MTEYTTFFSIYEKMQESDIRVDEMPQDKFEEIYTMSDEELLAALKDLLKGIQTLDDYQTLVEILDSLAERITLRFLYVFFQALVDVEERIWARAGMHPPIAKIMDEHIDLLLTEYTTFAYELEKALVGWTKETGNFNDPKKYEFIQRRNSIYSNYIIFVGKVIDAFS